MKKLFTSKKAISMLYWFNLICFLVPTVYLIFRVIFSGNSTPDTVDIKVRAEYILMLIQCILGLVVMHLPAVIEKKLRIDIPNTLEFLYLAFLNCAIFLGEVRNFYYLVPHWDDILHCISSVMNGLFGFIVVTILNQDKKVRMNLSPFFLALFAFCFSMAVGSVWEIYEFWADHFLGLNMQKFMLRDGSLLIGHEALSDTMIDIIVDCCGALIATVIGYFSIKNKTGWVHNYLSGENAAQTEENNK